ncbi:hypothetical protein WJX74_005939 [Apatococcus lobatus]|uniref:Autophagy-related protein 101 n=1 Tax=Apatococcus lobatus TaxID=904363 RepID=A0AAW1RW24_9CHLO
MSSCETTSLPVLEVEHHQIREVLRCLLHTIIFSRALGRVQPKEIESELVDITYVSCGDAAVEQKVEDKISHFSTWVEKHPSNFGQVCLSFYEVRQRAGLFSREDRVSWEEWCINLAIQDTSAHAEEQSAFNSTSGQAVRHAKLQSAMEGLMASLIQTISVKKDHIPPVVSTNTVTFPFDISIAGANGRNWDIFQRFLSNTPTPTVL